MKLRKHIFIELSVVVLISTLVIFFSFGTIPPKLDHDEVESAKLALSLVGEEYTPYSPLATGHATLYYYVILASFTLFGVSEYALRLPSAVSGVLACAMVYLLLLQVFSEKNVRVGSMRKYVSLALIGAILFTTSRWYFGFARFSFGVSFLILLELISLNFFYLFYRSRRVTHISLSALFAGLAFHSYTPGRIFFIVPLVAIIVALRGAERVRAGGVFLAIWGIVASPLIVYLKTNDDSRVQALMYLNNSDYQIVDKIKAFSGNFISNLFSFFLPQWGDGNGRHNYPLKPSFNLSQNVLLCVGVVNVLLSRISLHTVLFTVYFFIALIPTLLTYPHENPNMLRTATVLPSTAYFMSLGVYRLNHFLKKYLSRVIVGAIILLIILFSSLYDVRTYFVYQRGVFYESFRDKSYGVPYTISDALD